MMDDTEPTTTATAALTTDQRLDVVEAKLDALASQIQTLVHAQRPILDLAREVGPIADEMMSTGIDQLSHLQDRGYFDLAAEGKYLVDRLVEDYDPSDLHDLADNAANILDTVRMATQPSVMAVIRDAAESFDSARELEPVSPIGAVRRVRKDKNVQRGFAFVLDVLARVGRASARAPRPSRGQLAAAVSHAAPPSRETRRSSAASAAVSASATASNTTTGPGPADESTFVPDAEWSREVATATAAAYGVAELSENHWQLIDFVRAQYVSSGSTPNIRKVTKLSGIPTRDIYALFPKAPGKVMAATAGVPKPVGCL